MSCDINLEDILEEEFLKSLNYMYSYEDFEIVLNIFFLRCMIFNLKNNLSNEDIISFLYRELNLPKIDTLNYKDVKVFKNYYGYSTSIESIIDNWKFKVLDKTQKTFNNKTITIKEILMLKYVNYLSMAKKELRKINKSNKYYTSSLKHFMLLFLYKDFNIEYINEPKPIEGLSYTSIDDFYNKITIDLECFRYYNALCLEFNEKEKHLETFLYNKYNISNTNRLFGDIKVINRQYKIKAGVIDLLGRDTSGNIVIIELKVVNRPIDIFYQIKAYTRNIKEEFKTENVRFIAITPNLKEDIFEEISKENIELYYYSKKLSEYTFNKVI